MSPPSADPLPSRFFPYRSCPLCPGVGGGCLRDSDCLAVPGASCRGGVCACPEDTIPSDGDDSCLDVARAYGDPCTVDKQCRQV